MESRLQKIHSISWVYTQMKASFMWNSSSTNKMSQGGSLGKKTKFDWT